MKLSDIMTPSALKQAIEDGYVSERWHPKYDYRVLNYTPKSQYESNWTNVTMQCRGLILDKHDLVLFRPPKKFFNHGEANAPKIPLDAQVDVIDKLDGSFIAVFDTPGGLECATRGSFESQQAIDATAWLRKHHSQFQVTTDKSYFFEWIGPSNRIVLSYPEDQLVLLGAVNDYTGGLLPLREARESCGWTGTVAQDFHFNSFEDVLRHEFEPDVEGFVIRYNGTLVKTKATRYLELHRLIFGLNDKAIWRQLSTGVDREDLIKPLPDEFQDEVNRKIDVLLDQFYELASAIWSEYNHYKVIEDQKEFALAVKDSKYKSFLFAKKAGNDEKAMHMTWRAIEPKGDNAL